ncbi:transmembrane channel-like protein 3 [Narcine bancroftii]|uniref:transmembrane channel-like protein 3 n=1 Tax=Narcine bancroftii TaxID=1343680 RepID=UPI0038321FB9
MEEDSKKTENGSDVTSQESSVHSSPRRNGRIVNIEDKLSVGCHIQRILHQVAHPANFSRDIDPEEYSSAPAVQKHRTEHEHQSRMTLVYPGDHCQNILETSVPKVRSLTQTKLVIKDNLDEWIGSI